MNKNCHQSDYRKALRQRILVTAMQEFRRQGIRAVKMDDIAQLLSISKRTLYEIYNNKEELLLEGLKASNQEFDAHMLSYVQRPDKNVIDVVIEFYNYQSKRIAHISPSYYDEIAKYKKVCQYMEEHHKKRDTSAMQFFKRGVEEGFFRPDVDYQFINRIERASVQYALTNKLYKEHSVTGVFRNIILLFVRGICTRKGLEALETIK